MTELSADEFHAYLRDVRREVLDEIERHLPREPLLDDALYGLVRDYPFRPAKMLRPALCVAVARAAGASLEETLPTAAALEMYHNAFLIHDDVEDRSLRRRGRPTLQAEHGVPIAVNVGDALLALALGPLLANTEVLDLGRALRVLQVVADMARRTAEGQAIELAWIRQRRWSVSDGEYLDMVERKTAVYTFVAPVRAGGIIGRVPTERLDRLAEFARLLGVAFQIRDDVLSLVGGARVGKDHLGDLREGKRTLILSHFFSTAPAPERERAQRAMAAAAEGRDDELPAVLAALHAHGSIDHAERIAAAWRDRALAALDAVAPELARGVHLQFLFKVASFTAARAW